MGLLPTRSVAAGIELHGNPQALSAMVGGSSGARPPCWRRDRDGWAFWRRFASFHLFCSSRVGLDRRIAIPPTVGGAKPVRRNCFALLILGRSSHCLQIGPA